MWLIWCSCTLFVKFQLLVMFICRSHKNYWAVIGCSSTRTVRLTATVGVFASRCSASPSHLVTLANTFLAWQSSRKHQGNSDRSPLCHLVTWTFWRLLQDVKEIYGNSSGCRRWVLNADVLTRMLASYELCFDKNSASPLTFGKYRPRTSLVD